MVVLKTLIIKLIPDIQIKEKKMLHVIKILKMFFFLLKNPESVQKLDKKLDMVGANDHRPST